MRRNELEVPSGVVLSCNQEICVGEPLDISLHLPVGYFQHPHDWVGVYPKAIPTVPGVSHGRWFYIGNFEGRRSAASSQDAAPSVDALSPPSAAARHLQPLRSPVKLTASRTLTICFVPSKLPPHRGAFEVRFFRNNNYGKPLSTASFRIIEGPRSRVKAFFFFFLCITTLWFSQLLLNQKGTCPMSVHPAAAGPDAIQDELTMWTAPLNLFFFENSRAAALAQACSSALVDASLLVFFYLTIFRRNTVEPLLSLVIFLLARFLGQTAATMPPGVPLASWCYMGCGGPYSFL